MGRSRPAWWPRRSRSSGSTRRRPTRARRRPRGKLGEAVKRRRGRTPTPVRAPASKDRSRQAAGSPARASPPGAPGQRWGSEAASGSTPSHSSRFGFRFAAVLLASTWVVLFAPQLFSGRTFVLGDAPVYYPFGELSRARWLEAHERTLWNPYVFC